jgi:hypothetical protein
MARPPSILIWRLFSELVRVLPKPARSAVCDSLLIEDQPGTQPQG